MKTKRKPIGKREAAQIAKLWVASVINNGEPGVHFQESGLDEDEMELVADALNTLADKLAPGSDSSLATSKRVVDAVLAKRK